jgi:hypothetical protein
MTYTVQAFNAATRFHASDLWRPLVGSRSNRPE